jgi:histidyl-tRNA synthetase
MRDVLPEEGRRWREVEQAIRSVLGGFAYEEVHLPLLEFTELFARGVGEATDIVEKEMYTMSDRDGDSLSLRPEGTASCVRALNENGLLFNQTQKVFYAGPMFRYEKPQKGRYRQFYQVGAEAFGFAGPDVDAELIYMCAEFWRALGVHEHVELELNTLGSGDARQRYRDALVGYLQPLRGDLDEDSQRRLSTNPLRILDSKNPATQAVLASAPELPDFVDDDSKAHFAGLCASLDALGVAYKLNTKLVRGLDYYTHTVFEWVTDGLGAQGTVCAGGRYDGLVERLGGKPSPAVGFAVGLERVILLHEVVHQDVMPRAVDLYVCWLGDSCFNHAMQLAHRCRTVLPGVRVRVHMGGGNLKKQMKKADASGAVYAMLLGEDEVAAGEVTIKHLRDAAVGQERLGIEAGLEKIANLL